MKKVLLIICILLSTVVFRPVRAADAATPESDEILRAELRLSELGYLAAAPTGRENDAYLSALDAFFENNGLPAGGGIPALLYSAEAKPFPFSGGDERPLVAAGGVARAWTMVQPLLNAGDAYAVTICKTGVVVRLVYRDAAHCALFVPSGDWDDAALQHELQNRMTAMKLPVLLALGNERIACCLTVSLPHATPESGTVYRLLFSGDASPVGNLPDADVARILRRITVQTEA